MTAAEIIAKLKAPFPADAVSWRVGSTNKEKTTGLALAYIDARDVMDRLDATVGAENWRDEYQEVSGFLICKLWLKIDGEWTWKCDGAGKTDVEAEKGMVSDSFKRSAVKWGVGRYIYNLDSPWVQINQFRQIDKGEYAKLRQLLTRDAAATSTQEPPRTERAAPPPAQSTRARPDPKAEALKRQEAAAKAAEEGIESELAKARRFLDRLKSGEDAVKVEADFKPWIQVQLHCRRSRTPEQISRVTKAERILKDAIKFKLEPPPAETVDPETGELVEAA